MHLQQSATPETDDEEEKEMEESDETSIIEYNESNPLTSRFDAISNESNTILNSLKFKMNVIRKMYDQFNEATITCKNISNECKQLLKSQMRSSKMRNSL